MNVPGFKMRLSTMAIVIGFFAYGTIMLEAGIYKGQRLAQAGVAKPGGEKIVTVFKPETQGVDTKSSLFVDTRPGESHHHDWELLQAARVSVQLRKHLLESLQERNASPDEFEAADAEFVSVLKQLKEVLSLLESRIHAEQDASAKESKDAITKHVGDSG